MKDFWADQLKDFSSPILQENEVMEAQENPHAIMVAEASHAYPSKSNSSGISSISIFILPFLISIPLLFASIGHDSNEPDCLGTGEVTYHSADYCQESFFGDFRGMVGNQTIDGADYTIYEWEIGTINSWRFVDDFWSEEEWVSSAIYARLDFTTSPFRSGVTTRILNVMVFSTVQRINNSITKIGLLLLNKWITVMASLQTPRQFS